MKLLFLAPNPPSPIRVRSYEFVRRLSARGHAVTVAAPQGQRASGQGFEAIEGQAEAHIGHRIGRDAKLRSLAAAGLSGRPLQSAVAWDPRFAQRLADEIQAAAQAGLPFHVLHVEHLRAARYALALQPKLPLVWDSVDCISLLFEQARSQSRSLKGRMMAWVDLRRTQRWEGMLVNRLPRIVVTGVADRQRLLRLAESDAQRRDHRSLAGDASLLPQIDVVPNGVDLERFKPSRTQRAQASVILSGKMSYHANITAARYLVNSIMPRVWQRKPEARVVLAGAEPSPEVLALARADSRVTATGFVDDLGAQLGAATVAVAPLVYGAGIQNKVLEAMATQTPVVASELAAQALGAHHGEDLLVGVDEVDISEALVSLLEDPKRAAAVGAAGRRYVQAHHSWDVAAQSLESIYAETIARWGERIKTRAV